MTKKRLETIKQRLIGAAPAFSRRIAPIYELLEWRWVGCDSAPNAEEIENELVRIIKQFIIGTSDIHTGGLRVRIVEELGLIEGILSMEISESIYEGDE